MTLDQAIAEVQQIAGWRSDKATQIQAALQYAQTEREKPGRTYPWFLRKTNDSAIVTVAPNNGVYTVQYNIPSDYIMDTEEKEGNLYIYTGGVGALHSRTIFLRKGDFQDLQTRYYGEWPFTASTLDEFADQSDTVGPGAPIDYYLGDTFVILYPAPDAVYNISWRYWAADSAQALGQTNKWLTNAPWVLIGEAAAKICSDLQYQGGVQTAQAVLAAAEDRLFKAIIHREEAGRRRAMGSKL